MHGTKVVCVHVQHVKRCLDTCAACEKMYGTALPGQTCVTNYTTRSACIFIHNTPQLVYTFLLCNSISELELCVIIPFGHNLLEADESTN